MDPMWRFSCKIEKRVSLLEKKFEEFSKESLVAEVDKWKSMYFSENLKRRVLLWKVSCKECRKSWDIREDCKTCFKYLSTVSMEDYE